jgi:transposase-like protein
VKDAVVVSPTQQLAEQTLPGLPKLVGDLASEGLSWRAISAVVKVNSRGRIRVSHESLRRWYGEAS